MREGGSWRRRSGDADGVLEIDGKSVLGILRVLLERLCFRLLIVVVWWWCGGGVVLWYSYRR